MSPQIALQSELLQSGIVRIDVSGAGLPQDFLGIAFDLVVEGTWTFERSELCGSFRDLKGVVHLASEMPQQQRVVFGLVVTDRTSLEIKDGCIGSFYFRMEPAEEHKIFFERSTLSVDSNGRRDLGDVRWQQDFVVLPGMTTQQSFPSREQVRREPESLQTQILQPYGSFLPGEALKSDILGPFDTPLMSVYVVIFVTMALAAAVFGAIWVYFRLRKKD